MPGSVFPGSVRGRAGDTQHDRSGVLHARLQSDDGVRRRVRLGDHVTIGLGSVVEIGSDSQVGAMSFVPKYTKLKGGVVYAGTPAVPFE
jgi:acetyltransferase-like isoleucine patch superfamily enzyme